MSGGRRQSVPLLHGGSSKLRQGVLQLMIHSIDPMHSHHGGAIDPETGLVMVRNRRRSSGGQQSSHRSSMGGETSRPGTMTSKRGKNQEGKEEDDDEDKKEEEDGENDAANDAGKKGKKKDAEDEDDDERKGGRNVDDDPAIIPGMISNGSIGGATGATIRGERNNNPKGEGVTRTVRMPQVSIKNDWSLIQSLTGGHHSDHSCSNPFFFIPFLLHYPLIFFIPHLLTYRYSVYGYR